MKKLTLICLLIAVAAFQAAGLQAKHPVSFTAETMDDYLLDEQFMPLVNVEALLAEDAFNAVAARGIPYRVAQPQLVHLTIEDSGTIEYLADGARLWRVRVTSLGAEFLSFAFADFELPRGAELYFYSVEKDFQIGPFTARQNNDLRIFSSPAVAGDSAVIELFLPAGVESLPAFVVEEVSHGYRDFNHFAQVGYRDGRRGRPELKAQWCEVDVVCPEGNGWQNDKNAVARTYDGTYVCTGSMIANQRQDCTNYFLTANHCVKNSRTASRLTFYWNYENTSCGGGGAPTNHTSSGSALKASSSGSDFTLLELDATPDESYNVYYAGFNRSSSPPSSATCIHHPAGDPKKISHENDSVEDGGDYSGGYGGDHWRIVGWDVGTTEGGSSGSGLWNPSHQIIGQLHGGTADCSGGWDEYGKLSVSWTAGLSSYLDPDNTGVTSVNGHYPNANCGGGGECLPAGSSCTDDEQCCSNKCKGKGGSKTCK